MIIRIIFSYFATGAFSILFKTPAKYVPLSALSGMIGWSVYEVSNAYFSIEVAFVLSAFIAGFVSILFSNLFLVNSKIFMIPAVIPLVPGAPAFFSIQKFIEKDYNQAINFAYATFVAAFGIVIGLSMATYIFSFFNDFFDRKRILKYNNSIKNK
ncbi:membrane protein [Tepiditoga spiralis]|uniref:Membrane protein n=1 Tax=Tepiditoga spiralis TaxID=2108365 RepID=A0A7G1G2B0_9BACT|nr:threonine/serine exporter family protein [Tepiditoga spiralis]BBE30480.1 membrane protein [Tepiditoga spiralis]